MLLEKTPIERLREMGRAELFNRRGARRKRLTLAPARGSALLSLSQHDAARRIAYQAAKELGWLEAKEPEYEAFMCGYSACLKDHAPELLAMQKPHPPSTKAKAEARDG